MCTRCLSIFASDDLLKLIARGAQLIYIKSWITYYTLHYTVIRLKRNYAITQPSEYYVTLSLSLHKDIHHRLCYTTALQLLLRATKAGGPTMELAKQPRARRNSINQLYLQPLRGRRRWGELSRNYRATN